MIRYINFDSKGKSLPTYFKTDALIADGAIETDGEKFEENLVCIVENNTHDAALYCTEKEFNKIKSIPDSRPKNWVIYKTIHPKNNPGKFL